MKDIGSANVQGTLYDLLSPRVVGDYIENIGAACQNPDGYAANKIFVAYDSSMNQHLYKTTAQITQGTQITSSNCEQTSLSELLSGSGSSSSLEDLSDTDISSKTAGDIVEYNNSTGKWENTQKLVNLEKSIAPVEDGATLSQAYAIGEKFIRGGVRYKAKTDLASGTQFSSLIINTNYEAADDVSSEIQTLTNKLNDEIKTRAVLGAKNVFNPNLSTIATSTNYYSNIAVTVDSDKKITVNSTSDTSGSYSYKNIVLANNDSFNLEKGIEYIISGLETDDNATYFGLFRAYDSSNNEILSVVVGSTEASFTLPSNTATYNLLLCVGRTVSLSKTFYVMFRLVTDTDPTYQPYAKTNRELTEDTNAIEPMLNVLGAKNLLQNTASSATVNGITFTVNSDGSVTANGTATATASLRLPQQLPQGKYIISGLQGAGSVQTFRMWIGIRNSSDTDWVDSYFIEEKSGLEFEVPSGSPYVRVECEVRSGYTASNLVFKPMIRPASIEDDTYVPYAMTNRELTPIEATITPASGITLARNRIIKQGKLVYIYFKIEDPAPDTTSTAVVIGVTPFLPKNDFVFMPCYSIVTPFDIKHSAFIRRTTGEIVFPLGSSAEPVYGEVVYACQ